MRASSVSKRTNHPISPASTVHPFFATRASQPSSPALPSNIKKPVIDRLLNGTFTTISQLASAPEPTFACRRASILTAFESATSTNVLGESRKKEKNSEEDKTSPHSSPDQFHSTAASNSLAPSSSPEQFGVQFPMSPDLALSTFGKYLTALESTEIFGYQYVYFLGIRAEKFHGNPALPNCGYDDDRDDYKYMIGDHLDYRYEILDNLGKGAFGKVLKCFDHKEHMQVAVKVVRNARRFHKQVAVELQILQLLKENRIDGVVTMLEHFKFRGHICVVFELLGSNLFDYLRENRFRGFPLKWVRNIAMQLVDVMLQLKMWKVIHCDIKPENILFTDHNKGSVKLIDFGSACVDGAQMYTYIQSRFYRSPEVILGVKYSLPIDMWSLGCLLAELYTGRPLFPGENELDQLLSIMQVLGLPPPDLLSKSTKINAFFLPDGKPKLIPNSRGVQRNPSTVSLSKLIPCPDSNLLDFITRNL